MWRRCDGSEVGTNRRLHNDGIRSDRGMNARGRRADAAGMNKSDMVLGHVELEVLFAERYG